MLVQWRVGIQDSLDKDDGENKSVFQVYGRGMRKDRGVAGEGQKDIEAGPGQVEGEGTWAGYFVTRLQR